MTITQTVIRFITVVAGSSLLSGCWPGSQPHLTRQLDVQLNWHEQVVSCQQPIIMNNQQWHLQQLRVYLSDFKLDQQPQLLTATTWQQPGLALLGTDCQGNDNWQLAFAKPLTAGRLSFTLGLPFAVNHQNPLTANSPLNFSEMFWSWQLGYKFLRLDLQGPAHGWAFHLGSTGCQSASVLRPPTLPCRHSNTIDITLDYQPNQQLQLNLATLLAAVTLQQDNSCMSDRLQSSCQQLFSNLTTRTPWQMSQQP
jgi:uncharacterized repeat protein (TIGR04052 family)